MEIIDDAIVNFLLLKQKAEPFCEYIQMFRTTKEVAEIHLEGSIGFSEYIKTNSRYKIIDELKNKAWKGFAAYKLLKKYKSTKIQSNNKILKRKKRKKDHWK